MFQLGGGRRRGTSSAEPIDHGDDPRARHLRTLGLEADAPWAAIERAYRRLVADLTPGPSASHSNVALADELRTEVDRAYDALRAQTKVA